MIRHESFPMRKALLRARKTVQHPNAIIGSMSRGILAERARTIGIVKHHPDALKKYPFRQEGTSIWMKGVNS